MSNSLKTFREILPASLPPFGVNREQAAALIGISTTLFDKAVVAGTMPKPKIIGERRVYDVSEIAEAFRKLPHKGGDEMPSSDTLNVENPWD